jgi:hypothetical protein
VSFAAAFLTAFRRRRRLSSSCCRLRKRVPRQDGGPRSRSLVPLPRGSIRLDPGNGPGRRRPRSSAFFQKDRRRAKAFAGWRRARRKFRCSGEKIPLSRRKIPLLIFADTFLPKVRFGPRFGSKEESERPRRQEFAALIEFGCRGLMALSSQARRRENGKSGFIRPAPSSTPPRSPLPSAPPRPPPSPPGTARRRSRSRRRRPCGRARCARA